MYQKDFYRKNEKEFPVISWAILLIALLNMALCENSYAGNLDFDSSLTLEEEYDDNAFLSSQNEIEDSIIRVKPSFEGKYEFSSESFIESKYDGEAIFHRKNMPFVDDEIRHELSSLLNIELVNNLTLKISDEYNEIPINIRDPERFKGDLNNLSGKNTFYSSLVYDKNMSKTFNLNIEPFYRKIKTEDSNINDREIKGGSIKIRKEFSATTFITAEYEFNRVNQSLSPNYDSHNIRGGINYAWKDKLLLSFSGGKQKKEYEKQDSLDGFVITTRADYKVSSNLGLSAEFNKSLEDDEGKRNSRQNASKREETNVSLEYRFLDNKARISLMGSFSRKTFTEVTREDNTDSYSVSGVYFPTKKMSFVLSGQYRENEYITDLQNRDDEILSGSAGVNFHPYDWLSTGIRYYRQDRDSSVSNNKYVVNRYTFQLTFIF